MAPRTWLCVMLALSGASAAAQPEREESVERLLAESIRKSDGGWYLEAREFARTALEQARAFGPDSTRSGYVMNQLGVVDHALGQYQSAEDAYKRGLAVGEKRHDNLLMTRILSNLARLYIDFGGRHAEAEAALRRVLQLEATVPDHHAERTLANLAEVRQMRGDARGARQLYVQAFDALKRDPKSTPARTAPLLEGIALLEVAERRPDEALSHLQQAVAAWGQELGVDHPHLIAPLLNIGRVLLKEKRAASADPPLQRAQKIAESRLGPEHPVLVAILETRVLVLRKTKNRKLARQLEQRCKAIAARQSDWVAAKARVNVSDLIDQSSVADRDRRKNLAAPAVVARP
jgi:tetratricopeptide (TPR) repeat protein